MIDTGLKGKVALITGVIIHLVVHGGHRMALGQQYNQYNNSNKGDQFDV